MKMPIKLLKCGVRFDKPAIVITYTENVGKYHRRTMPLRNFTKFTGIERAVDELLTNSRHQKYLKSLPRRQLLKLVTIVHDRMNGLTLDASLRKSDRIDTIDPEEDLNKVEDDVLSRKKAVMDETFSKHQKKPGDDDFVYDVEVDFTADDAVVESCGWDSEESDLEF
ncbi:centrosomal protein of 19 kDa-like [Tubulanus polymorphus]|uniref:centrosomal protein of 19 kDa-like n=1 Tax=Tubulanus polymorphus TaxID=672921 RepID=UPI003DA552FB